MPTIERIGTVTIAVPDQDAALSFFVDKLGFEKRADMPGPMRWLTVAPPGQTDVEFLLASWFPDHVGKSATCVALTRDCAAAYDTLVSRGVEFVSAPQARPYGVEAVFRDPWGNRYALVQRAS